MSRMFYIFFSDDEMIPIEASRVEYSTLEGEGGRATVTLRGVRCISGEPVSFRLPLGSTEEQKRPFANKLLLITGAESTGSRLFTGILSQHPLITGTEEGVGEHEDILDGVWECLQEGDTERALARLPDLGQGEEPQCLLTRRLIPHGFRPGVKATPEDVPNLCGLYTVAQRAGLELVVLVNNRSPAANLASWTLTRASTSGSLKVTKEMYERAYRYIFDFLCRYEEVPYLILSLEALLLDGQVYVQSLFKLLGLPTHVVKMDLRTEVNIPRYVWYGKEGSSLLGEGA